ncbi:Dihydrofolate reductase [Rathayibacter oskolensis]|uniref:Dihydrofolate reductase n=1 Tax=Rathayibacter oskolensis TaxID=1891671 RepID=A0A1X7NC47_9MICO|nr:dihydrofolate reductase family protein [Rathayibacter oskolensis]SMH35172.1 Dihydrofolate reductase [Rathayibacter oskolensis]
MGELVVQQFVTADGFAASPGGAFDVFEGVGTEMADFEERNTARMPGVGSILLGRATYEMFVQYWPTAVSDGELIADAINLTPKHVVSSTLTEAPWGTFDPASVIGIDDVAGVVERPGDTLVWGSLTLTQHLFAANAVDRVRLVVLPTAIGRGIPWSPEGVPLALELLDVARFANGMVETEYRVARR